MHTHIYSYIHMYILFGNVKNFNFFGFDNFLLDNQLCSLFRQNYVHITTINELKKAMNLKGAQKDMWKCLERKMVRGKCDIIIIEFSKITFKNISL